MESSHWPLRIYIWKETVTKKTARLFSKSPSYQQPNFKLIRHSPCDPIYGFYRRSLSLERILNVYHLFAESIATLGTSLIPLCMDIHPNPGPTPGFYELPLIIRNTFNDLKRIQQKLAKHKHHLENYS